MSIITPRFCFIPRPLSVKGRPELSNFSFNILFGCGWNYSASALYVPQIDTYQEEDGVRRLWYVNQKDGNGHVCLEYKAKETSWIGNKFYGGEELGTAWGTNWHHFFVHLTSLGCDPREKLQYQPDRNLN